MSVINYFAVVTLVLLVKVQESSAVDQQQTVSPKPNNATSDGSDSLEPEDTALLDQLKCFEYASMIHYIVYLTCSSISVITCLVAFFVYITIRKKKDIREETRHWINWNFMVSFILRDCVVIILIALIFNHISIPKEGPLRYLFYLLTYIIIVNFYWAFVEGLWLYLGVVYPFRFRNFHCVKLKLILIGWVTPGVLTIIFAVTTEVFTHIQMKRLNISDYSDEALHPMIQPSYEGCIRAPIFLLLFINLLMMIRVLIEVASQMRGQASVHTPEQHHMHRRLAKATIALVFLLGLFYIIPEITLPILDKAKQYCALEIVSAINDTMSSLQGCFVAIFYVLTNKEVLEHSQRRVTISTNV